MKSKHLSTKVLIISTLICSQCKKDDNYPTYFMSDEFKSYAVHPEGSYWIFRETTTGAIDSVYLYLSEVEIRDAESKLGYNYESLIANYYSSRDSNLTLQFSYPDSGDQTFYQLEELGGNNCVIFFDNHPVGTKLDFGSVTSYEAEYLSFTIAGITYANVKVFSENSLYFPLQKETIYFAKNVGIVKRELYNGEVWEVEKYFINK